MTITRKLGGVSQKWYNIVKKRTLPVAQGLIDEFKVGWNYEKHGGEVEIKVDEDGNFVFTPTRENNHD